MFRFILTFCMIGLLAVVSWADEPQQERGDQGRQRNPERRVDDQRPRDADRPRDPDRPRDGDRDRDAQRRDEPNHDRMAAEMQMRLQNLRHMHERLQHEHADGKQIDIVRQQIERIEQEQRVRLAQRERGQRDREHEQHEESDRRRQQDVERLEHLHIAAEHLARAGLHEAARDVRAQADELERDLHGHRREGEHPDELHRMLHEMREQMDTLSREVRSLRGDVDRMRRN